MTRSTSAQALPPASLLGRLAPPVLVVLATLAAYLPSLSGDFIWNDADYVTAPALRSVAGLRYIWVQPGVTQQYYPLLHSAFWVQYRLWGDHPLGYHGVTLILHAASAVLFGLVLRRLFTGVTAAPAAAAWLAALLFALHPVHVESVAWITEQKNTLSLALYLAAALAYLRFDRDRRPAAYAAAFAFFVLSVLSKTVTVTLPAGLLVALWWRRGRLGWRRDIVPLLPWFAFGAAMGVFSSWVEKTFVGAEGASFELGAAAKPLVAGRAVWFYLGKLAWPADLNFIYPRWNPEPGSAPQWLFPAAALALGVALWAIRGRTRGPLAAYLFFVGSLFPVLGVVSLYGQLYSWVWDHWQYLPDLGPIALAAGALVAAWRHLPRVPRGLGAAAVAAAALVLGSLSWAHCAMFRDNETLYRTTLERNPGAWMAHNNLGLLLSKLPGRTDDAEAEYQAALKLKPDNARTHANLGNIWIRQPGRRDDAIAEYEEALRLEPDYSDAHFYLANALVQSGRTEEAIGHFERSLELEPARAEVSNNLGIVLCRTGRVREGLARIEAAIRIQPDYAPAHFARGIVFLQSGQRDEAVAEFRRVLELHPGDPAAQHMLSILGGAP